MTVVQLKALAKKRGLSGYSRLKKSDLQSLLSQSKASQGVKTVKSAKTSQSQTKGELREISLPDHQAALFLTKDPGSKRYAEMYVYGPKAIAYTRTSLKKKLQGYRYIKTQKAFLKKIGMEHLVNETVAGGLGPMYDKRPRKQEAPFFPSMYAMYM